MGKDYIDKLIQACEEARQVKHSDFFELEFENLIVIEKDDVLSKLNSSNLFGSGLNSYIYIFEQVGGDPRATIQKLSEYKESNEIKCPKINYDLKKNEKTPTPVMYVGSSTTNIKNRLLQHIGFGHVGTYALNLKYWFEAKCKVTVMEYKNVSPQVLQIIEDSISYELNPMFGKMGGNSK